MLRDLDAAPFVAGQLGADPPRAQTREAQRERDHLLLQMRANLVGHPRPPPLADVERLQAPAVDLVLPAVIGRVMDPHRPTRRTDTNLLSEREQPPAIADQHVIIRHALSPQLVCLGRLSSLKERTDAPASWPGRPTSQHP